jgi:hypothetical protein
MTDLMSIDIEQRLTQLEAENRALKAELADIRQNGIRKVIPAPPIEPAVKISSPVTPIAVDLPDGKQIAALIDLCRREFPAWCDSEGYCFGRRGSVSKEENDFEYTIQFAAAIRAISHMRVLDAPDLKRYVSTHVDAAYATLRAIGKPAHELRGSPFLMACFCMHIPVSGVGVEGASKSLGLSEHVGKPVDPSVWRAVLQAGKLPAQHAVEKAPYWSPRDLSGYARN